MTQSEEQAVAQVAERLHGRFPDFPAGTVEEIVARLHHEFDGRPVRGFVPVLVERGAVDSIKALSSKQRAAANA